MASPSNPYGSRPGGGISLSPEYRPTPSVTNRNYFPPNEPLQPAEMRIAAAQGDEIGHEGVGVDAIGGAEVHHTQHILTVELPGGVHHHWERLLECRPLRQRIGGVVLGHARQKGATLGHREFSGAA